MVTQIEKKEMQNLVKRYPKAALQGLKLDLDAEWKKALVAVEAMGMIYIDITKKMTALSNQLSESFDEAMKNGTQIPLNESTKQELQAVFRIKNLLLSSADTLPNPIPQLDAIVREHQKDIEKEVYLYYVSSKAALTSVLNESHKTVEEIDSTVVECFRDVIQSGVNIEIIEKQAIAGIDTKKDIRKLQEAIYSSVGLQII